MSAKAVMGVVFMEVCCRQQAGHHVGRWGARGLASFLAGLAGLMFLSPVQAGAHPGGPTITPKQAKLAAPFVELGAMDSQPGDNLDTFVLRVGEVIHAFTQSTGHEACGVFMVANDDTKGSHGPWRVRLTTNRSHITCVLVEYEDPGYRRLGPGIHSHPYLPSGFSINPQDERWRKPRCNLADGRCLARLENAPRCGDDWEIFDSTFSARDFEHGPGYLVARGRVLYQHGEQYPVRMVGEVEKTTPHALDFKGGYTDRIRMAAAAVAAWQGGEDKHIPAIRCSLPGTRHNGR